MRLGIDNKGSVDLANNWSIGGRTRHIEVKQHFLRELKEEGLIETEWITNEEMVSNMFTKNLGGKAFEKCTEAYVGRDKYMKQ